MSGPVAAGPRRLAPPSDGGLSRSARYVAMVRALLDRPSVPSGDPAAETRLCASLLDERNIMWQFMAARTAFVDARLQAELSAGVAQVVVLGAGYDGRAMRFRTPGVTFFELDLPAVQQDKRRRLRRLGIDCRQTVFVPADFTRNDVAGLLAAAGHDERRRTVVICEGLLLYLPRWAIRRLMRQLHVASAAGSALVVTFAVARPDRPPARPPTAAAAGGTDMEHRQSFFTPDAALSLLRDCGWSPDQVAHPDPGVAAADDVALFAGATRIAEAVAGGATRLGAEAHPWR